MVKEQIGVIGVDSGLCWIGDPCYIHHDQGGQPPAQELGMTWGEFCDNLGKDFPTKKQFNYDKGHEGLGVCVSTGYGDGTYPVYADIVGDGGYGKRIKSVTIMFI